MGEAWKGGDVGRSIGGGQKVRLLMEAMKTLADQEDLIVLSVDRYGIFFSLVENVLLFLNHSVDSLLQFFFHFKVNGFS